MATDLGKAYVQIMPSAQGIKGSITQALGGEAESSGSSLGAKLSGSIKKAMVAAGIGVALKKVIGDAVGEGAKLEQSIGGIQTLFGTQGANSLKEYAKLVGKSAKTVKKEYQSLAKAQKRVFKDADKAYMESGLSANEYMETATSFSAALVSSLNGNTKKAAKITKTAIVDMSDNANKMGTDMQSIQNAYQGFAKQNYTMLDNLKLGKIHYCSV